MIRGFLCAAQRVKTGAPILEAPARFMEKSPLRPIRPSMSGVREGAAARLEWDRIPRELCGARLLASEARTFAPLCGPKATGFWNRGERELTA